MKVAGTYLGYILEREKVRQASLARAVRFSTKYVSQVVRGHAPMSVEFAVAVERELQLYGLAYRLLTLQLEEQIHEENEVRNAANEATQGGCSQS